MSSSSLSCWRGPVAALLLLTLFSDHAFANRAYRRVRQERVVGCDLPLLPHQSTDLPERLNEFVAREGRLPEPARAGERPLYRRMTVAVTQGRLMIALFDPQVVTLIRRDLFYRNSFFTFLEQTEGKLPAELSDFEQRWLYTFRAWGDDPFPEDTRREFESLLGAQSERRGPDGKRVLSDLNAFVAAHFRLPSQTENRAAKDRLARYLSNHDPAILQLSPYARVLVKRTQLYRRLTRELEETWRRTRVQSPSLRFRLALWRWFSK